MFISSLDRDNGRRRRRLRKTGRTSRRFIRPAGQLGKIAVTLAVQKAAEIGNKFRSNRINKDEMRFDLI